ncbi:MAG: hypothetical protein ACLQE9_21590 [Roseiarcus sp.]
MTKAKLIFAALALSVVGLGATAASADTQGQLGHSRRAEVNARLAHENLRIAEALRAGLISPARAHALHRQVHSIRMQERAFAAAQNGHITHRQQRLLNREETMVGGQIAR